MRIIATASCAALFALTLPLYAATTQAAATPIAPHSVPWCTTAMLRAEIGMQDAGVGNIYTTLLLRNVSSHSCWLQGFPGVSLIDATGKQIGRSAHWDYIGPIAPVVLASGRAAQTTIRSLNPGVGTTNCLPPSTAIRVIPPDQRSSLTVRVHLSECLGLLSVKPLSAA